MKFRSFLTKGLILLSVLTFPMIAGSCSWFGGDQNQSLQEEAVQVKKVGVLKSLGGMSVGDATHLLEDEEGSTLRLRSLNIDLDQDKYINHKVEVRGTVTKANDGKEVMDVLSIDLSEEEDNTVITQGEEKEYKNAALGFTLTYDDSWTVEENDESVIFVAPVPKTDETATSETPEPDLIIIKQIPNPLKETVEEFLNLPSDPNETIILGYVNNLIGKDMLEGLKKESSNKLEINMWLAREKFVYEFSFVGADNTNTVNNRNRFYTMVSSFKFIGFDIAEDAEDAEATEEDTANDIPEVKEPTKPAETDNYEIEVINTENKTTQSVSTSSSSSYGLIAQYVNETLGSIAPESAASGTWKATNFEFVDPNYVYVEYTDGSDDRRLLLSYNQEGGLSTKVIGYFKPGETTSWERVSGENPVESAEKTVVTMTSEGAQETAKIQEGYRYFESLPYDFNAQYPSNWYFNGMSGSGDVSHHYGFSNEPVENGNELVSIDIISGTLPGGTSISVGGHAGVKVYSGSEVAIYIKRDDGKLYKIHGGTENEEYVVNIAASIKEL